MLAISFFVRSQLLNYLLSTLIFVLRKPFLMKAASTKQIKEELKNLSQKEVVELCLKLVRFKKENKELLSYLLFDSGNRQGYADIIKQEINEAFTLLPSNRYLRKKGLSNLLKNITKYSRYMGEKEAEAELRLHFCRTMKLYGMASHKHQATMNTYTMQLDKVQSLIHDLHEDAQYDIQKELNELID